MALVSRTLSTLALIGTAVVACGSRSELYVSGAIGSGSPTGDDAGSDDSGLDAALEGSLDGTLDADARPGDELPACMGRPIQLTLLAPNLYFVLDHSTSMTDMNKWSNVRQVVAQLMTQIGAGARFGATMFPGVSSLSSCDVGVEVMSLRQGDAQGVVAGAFLAATAATPLGGTPTAATLESLRNTLPNLPGTTYAILATDGGPNCNPALSCTYDQCTTNVDMRPGCPFDGSINCCAYPSGDGSGCLDEEASVKGASDLAAAGVKTFVIGIPGSLPYGVVLDRLAIAGGTARASEPFYYQVATADTAALTSTFAQIVAQTGAGCVFTLANAPALGGVRVVLNGSVVPSSGPNRWSLSGKTLTLHGTSCASVQTAGAPSLQLYDGCN